MAYWLLKSEPDEYPWAKLATDGHGQWDGVRNFQARKHLMAMQPGDEAFFYHTGNERQIVAVMKVVKAAYPDDTFTPEPGKNNPWVRVDVAPVAPVTKPVTLAQMKADPALAGFPLLTQARLSVMPVTPAQWRHIMALAQ